MTGKVRRRETSFLSILPARRQENRNQYTSCSNDQFLSCVSPRSPTPFYSREEAVDGDQLSSAEEGESSEASEGGEGPAASPPSFSPRAKQEDEYSKASEGKEGAAASPPSPSPRAKRTPTKWSPLGPFATPPRKRGRPKKPKDLPAGEKRKRGRPRKDGSTKPKKRRVGRPTKAESEARKRESAAAAGTESPRPVPRALKGSPQISSKGRYTTKNGKGPRRRPEQVFLIESDTDEEDEVVSRADQDEKAPGASRLPAFSYEVMEDDTAEVAAVAAAVAARAAQEAAP